eukprot:1162098-Pelagomonas_calceolata.AAC.3
MFSEGLVHSWIDIISIILLLQLSFRVYLFGASAALGYGLWCLTVSFPLLSSPHLPFVGLLLVHYAACHLCFFLENASLRADVFLQLKHSDVGAQAHWAGSLITSATENRGITAE